MVDTPSIAISLQNTKPFRTNFGSVGPLEVKRTTPVKSAGISSLLVMGIHTITPSCAC